MRGLLILLFLVEIPQLENSIELIYLSTIDFKRLRRLFLRLSIYKLSFIEEKGNVSHKK